VAFSFLVVGRARRRLAESGPVAGSEH
jgi:hypothetical protein